ncbi:MAG TPA: PKD domain-containing protein [Candidatus Saccharimonadales bacterium]|nr:PKD domain-containing protein [Candidatus Saccharimonadales bacterium]
MNRRWIARTSALALLTCLLLAAPVAALDNPQSNSMGLEATVSTAAPTQAATIATPSNGQTFTSTPITVSGLCKTGLLVKIFSNNIFVGSAVCAGGSYSLKIDLFSGRNDLVARVYDALDQQGPDSNTVSVTFNDAQFAQFGSRVSITSSYARRGADPGSPLDWSFILSGGTGPYALSFDWGDGSANDLKSVSFPGVINVSHTYQQAGVYTIVVKATDANGTTAYLQVVGVANGTISGSVSTTGGTGSTGQGKTEILWQPMLIAIPLLLTSFWLGRRHELYMIRRSIENSRSEAQ